MLVTNDIQRKIKCASVKGTKSGETKKQDKVEERKYCTTVFKG